MYKHDNNMLMHKKVCNNNWWFHWRIFRFP